MTIALEKWKAEPEPRSVLAVFGGEADALRTFVRDWGEDGQPLAIGAVRLNSGIVGDLWPGAARPLVFALQLPETKHYWIHWWLRRSQNWRLFYRSKPEPKSTAIGELFLPWGQIATSPSPRQPDRINIVWDQRSVIHFPSKWTNIDDFFRRVVRVTFSPDWTTHDVDMDAPAAPPPVPAQLGLRLVDKVPEASMNPARELVRVEQRIRELQLVEGALRWQAREAPLPVALHVYPETSRSEAGTGSQWDLRRWLQSASTADIAQFRHARVTASDLGILHLVVPESFGRPSAAVLPPPRLILDLDERWRRLDGEVFVSRGHQLQPSPPDHNPSLVEEMARGLWASGAKERDRVLVFRAPRADAEVETQCLSVPKAAFKPLAQQMVAFNMPVAAHYQAAGPAPTDLTDFLAQSERSVQDALAAHITSIHGALDGAWGDGRTGLQQQRRQIIDVLEQHRALAEEIEAFQTEMRPRVRDLLGGEWGKWTSFLSALLDEDRGSIPRSRAHVAAWLQDLDTIRSELSALVTEPDPQGHGRTRLAKLLQSLANSIGRSNASP